MSEHTPGPWVVRYGNYIRKEYNRRSGTWIAVASAETVEDAQFIVAAPDMEAALASALEWFDNTQEYGDTPPEWVIRARAALAKSKGETPDE